jgi:hypothetical protein
VRLRLRKITRIRKDLLILSISLLSPEICDNSQQLKQL